MQSLAQFHPINQSLLRLQTVISNGTPESMRAEIQVLNEALYNHSVAVPETGQPTSESIKVAQSGLLTVSALTNSAPIGVLLDGKFLYPMLVNYLKAPWLSTGLSPISFAIIHNLCQLNAGRLDAFVVSGLIPAMVAYVAFIDKNLVKESPEAVKKKLNLALSLLYRIGGPKMGLQTQFISQGGLQCVLDHLNLGSHVLTFLTNFISLETPREALDIILSNSQFVSMVDSMYSKDAGSDSDSDDDDEPQTDVASMQLKEKTLFVIQILRNLALLPGSADYVLSSLPRFLAHDLDIADEAISALSNLSGTQQFDYRYAWDSNLIGMILSRATQICDKLIEKAQADKAAPIQNQNMPARKHVLSRVVQILRSSDCMKAASQSSSAGFNRQIAEEDQEDQEEPKEDSESDSEQDDDDFEDELVFTKDDAIQMVDLICTSKDVLQQNTSYAKVFSQYLSLLAPKISWSDNDELVSAKANCVIEKDVKEYYLDKSTDLDALCPAHKIRDELTPTIMWRRLSMFSSKSTQQTSPILASEYTVVEGEFKYQALSAFLAALNKKDPEYLATLISLPSADQSCWNSGPITVKLHDIENTDNRIEVVIDDYVPCYVWGVPSGLRSGASSQNFLPLIEKACAKHVGGYENLSTLSLEKIALMLTGRQVISKQDKIPKTIEEWQSSMKPGTIWLWNKSDLPGSLLVLDQCIATEGDGYRIFSCNPAAFDKRRGWDSNSNHLEISFDQFIETCSEIYVISLE